MEEDSKSKQRQMRYNDDQVTTYKITEQYDEDEQLDSEDNEEETEVQDERKYPQYDSQNRNKNIDLTQQSIKQINQNYNKYVINQQNSQYEEEDNMNFSKNILSLHNTTSFTNGSSIQNQRYHTTPNQEYASTGSRYSPFKYQIDADELKSKRKSLERETIRMEEEVKFLKQNLLSELYKQKQYENSRLYNLIYIIYVASERNKKLQLKESFHKVAALHFGALQKAERFFQEKQISKLYIMWNNWKNYMLDIKVNTLRQLVKQKMMNTEKIYERQSIQYHNKKLKAKSFAGWFYYFKKNKALLARKRQRVNIHEIFSNYNSKDCSPIRQSSKKRDNFNDQLLQERENSNEKQNLSNIKLNQSRSCKVCKVLDKKKRGNSACQGGTQCTNNLIIDNKCSIPNQNSNSQSNLKQKLLESLSQVPAAENILQIQPGSTKMSSNKTGQNSHAIPTSQYQLNSRKPSQKANNAQDAQYLQNKENIYFKEEQEKEQNSPQRKLLEVIANAKSRIQQFQNSTTTQYPFQAHQQKGYLTHLSDDNQNICDTNSSFYANQPSNPSSQIVKQQQQFSNQKQNDSFFYQNESAIKKQDKGEIQRKNENIFLSTLKKNRNTEQRESCSTGKNNISDLRQTKNGSYNPQHNYYQPGCDGYNASPLKDSSSNYKNQYNQQKNPNQSSISHTQDYYGQLQQHNGYNAQQSLSSNQSPKFNTAVETRVNFGFNQIEDEDEGYNIQNIFAKKSSKNIKQKENKSHNQQNGSVERQGVKQQQSGSKQNMPFTTFKQRSNSISQYCKSSQANTNTSIYSQITSRRNSLHTSKTAAAGGGYKQGAQPVIQTDGFQFVSPSHQGMELVSNKSFYQDTRSSSMKKRNDSISNNISNYFSQSRKNSTQENNSMVFSFYHPTNSKNIRNLQKSPFENRFIDDEQFIEEQQNEYNPVSFENSLRQEHNLNLSLINGSNVNPNKSGFLDSSLQNKILTPKEQDKNLRQIEKRALERKKRLDELKKKQLEWKKTKEDQQKQNEEKELEKEREKYQKEYREYQAIKRVQKKNKKTTEEQKQQEKENEEKAIQFYQKNVQKMAFNLLIENHECHGKLEMALEFQYNFFQRKIFKALVNQTINEKDRQRIKEQAELEKAINHYNSQLKRKCLDQVKIFTYESLVEKESYAKQREEILLRSAFQSLFQQLPIKKKTEIDVDKVIKQFRKVVLLERGFRGWKGSCK